MQRLFHKTPLIVQFTQVNRPADVKDAEHKASAVPALSALNMTRPQLRFPDVDLTKISHLARGVVAKSWLPLSDTLWGRILEGTNTNLVQLFDIEHDCEAYIQPSVRKTTSTPSTGLGRLDDCFAVVHANHLDLWKFKNKSVEQVSSVKINDGLNRMLVFYPHSLIQIQRLSPEFVVLAARRNKIWSEGFVSSALFAINTTTRDQEKYKIQGEPKFSILPENSSATKKDSRFVIVKNQTNNVKVLEVNTKRNSNWVVSKGVIWFNDLKVQEDDKDDEIELADPSHISIIRRHGNHKKITGTCFEIAESKGKFVSPSKTEIPDDPLCPEEYGVRYPAGYEILNRWIFIPETMQCRDLLNPEMVFTLGNFTGECLGFHHVSDSVMALRRCTPDGDFVAEYYETPQYQIRVTPMLFKILIGDATNPRLLLPPLAKISLQYFGIGLFHQNPELLKTLTPIVEQDAPEVKHDALSLTG